LNFLSKSLSTFGQGSTPYYLYKILLHWVSSA